MDFSDWKRTVVDWFNCLSITTSPISDIQELLDGSIFINLIRTLKDVPKTSKNLEPLQELTIFLRDEYPGYKTIYNSTYTDNEELICISCILIHFCCIRCDNKYYKQLMCNGLDDGTQKQIASLLKAMVEYKNNVTRNVLLKCISKKNYKENSPEMKFTSPSISPSRNSNHVPFSPRTPHNTMLQKSNWEIKRLQAELDSEKFDKTFLEEKLKAHAEQISCLIEDQKKYTAEVKRLRQELSFNENSPPNQNEFKQSEQSPTQNVHLKNEIEYLEDELQRLQREIDSLQNEKDGNKQKLQQMDTQCQMWQERASDLENCNENLLLEINKREMEHIAMKEQCSELTSIINEYRSVQRHNMSIEGLDMSLSNSSLEANYQNDEESLACSVIDVQLREREDENMKLTDKIKDLEKDLSSARNLCQEQCVIIEKNQAELETMSNSFQIKQQELLLNLEEKNVLQKEMESINSLLQERWKKLELTEKRASFLHDELTEANIKVSKTQEYLNESTSKVETLQILNEDLKKQFENSRELLADKIIVLLKITSGEDTCIDNSVINFQDAIKYLQDIIIKTQKNCILKDDLERNIADLTGQIQTLRAEAIQTNMNNLKYTEELNKQLDSAKESYIQVEKESNDRISNLNNLLSEKLLNIEELTNLNNRLNEESSKNSCETESIRAENEKNIQKFANLKISETILNEKYIESRTTVEELSKNLNDKTKEIVDLINSNKENVEKYNVVETQLLDMRRKYESLLSEITLMKEISQTEKVSHEEQLSSISNEKIELLNKIALLENDIKKCDLESLDLNNEVNKLTAMLSELKATNNEINSKYENKCKSVIDLKNDYDSVVQELEREKEQLKIIIGTQKDDIQKELQEKLSLKTDLENNHSKIEKYETTIEQLKDNIRCLENQYIEIKDELEKKNKTYDIIQEEKISVEKEYNTCVNEYKAKLIALENVLSELNIEKASIIMELDEKCISLEQMRESISAISKTCAQKVLEKDLEIERLELVVENFKSSITELRLKIDQSDNSLKEIEEERQILESKNAELTNTASVLEQQNIDMDNHVTKILEKYQLLDAEHINLKDASLILQSELEIKVHSLNDTEQKYQKIVAENVELEKKTCSSVNEMEIMQKELQDMQEQYQTAQSENIELKSIALTSENEIESLIKKMEPLQQAKDELDNLKTKIAAYEKCIEDDRYYKEEIKEEHCKEIMKKELRIDELLVEILGCKEKLTKLQEMYDHVSVELETVKETLLKTEETKNTLEAERLTSNEKLVETVKDKDKLTEEYEEKIEALTEKLKVLNDKNEYLKNDLNESKEGLRQIGCINNDLQTRFDEKTKLLDELSEEKVKMEDVIINLQTECTDLTTMLKTKNEKVQDLEKELAAAISLHTENCKKIEESAAETHNKILQEKNKLMLQIKELLETLEIEKMTNMSKVNELSAKVQELDKEKQLGIQLQLILDEEKLCKENLSALIQDMHNEKTILSKNFAEIKLTVSTIKYNLDTFKSEHRDLNFLENFEWHNDDFIGEQTQTIEITNYLKSVAFEFEKFIIIYKNFAAVEIEKRELEQKYYTLKEESDKLVLESKLNLEILERCNKDLLAEKHTLTEDLEDYKRIASKSLDLEVEINSLLQQQNNFIIEHENLVTKNNELQTKLSNIEIQNNCLIQRSIKEGDCIKLEALVNIIKAVISDLFDLFKRYEVQNKYYEKNLTAFRKHSDDALNAKSELDGMLNNIQEEFYAVSANVIDELMNYIRNKSITNTNGYDDFNGIDLFNKLQEIGNKSKSAADKCEQFEKINLNYKMENQIEEDVCMRKLKQDIELYQKKYIETKNILSDVLESKNVVEKKLIDLQIKNSSLLEEKQKQLLEFNNAVSVKTESASSYETENKPSKLNLEVIKLNQELSDVISVKDDLSEELTLLKEKFVKISEQLAASQTNQKYFEVLNDNSELKQELSVILQKLEDQTVESQVVKRYNERLREELRTVESKYNSLKIQYTENDEQKQKRIDDLKYTIHNLQSNSVLDSKVDIKVKEVRNEYEGKLEKMKAKMKELYTEEMIKVKEKQDNETTRLQTLCKKYSDKIRDHEAHVVDLSNQIFTLGEKIVAEQSVNSALNAELSKLREKNLHNETYNKYSMESLKFMQDDSDRGNSRTSTTTKTCNEYRVKKERMDTSCRNDVKRHTLPKYLKPSEASNVGYMDVIEETTTIKRMSMKPVQSNVGQALHMEDEDSEMFNNTYLSDLKAGRCNYGHSGLPRESSSNRLSELQRRNSLCPPHLKSTYATEVQFDQCKEEDLKVGLNPFDSSSSSLLPGEKTRLSKDRSGTAYKKPGPPTPSKNGGRQSLQGNEVHPREILKEFNENVKEKKKTPNRLKALFSSATKQSSQMGKVDNENEVTTPRRSLSFFRKAR